MAHTIGLLVACAVIGVVSVPLILKMVPPNPVYGFRTRRTLADRELWFQANYFAGWSLLIASAISGVLVVFSAGDSTYQLIGFVVPLALATLACFMYLSAAGPPK